MRLVRKQDRAFYDTVTFPASAAVLLRPFSQNIGTAGVVVTNMPQANQFSGTQVYQAHRLSLRFQKNNSVATTGGGNINNIQELIFKNAFTMTKNETVVVQETFRGLFVMPITNVTSGWDSLTNSLVAVKFLNEPIDFLPSENFQSEITSNGVALSADMSVFAMVVRFEGFLGTTEEAKRM